MTPDEFQAYLAFGNEQPGVEFKGPGSLSDSQLKARVVRAVLGMSNRRGGGVVVIGVAQNTGGILEPRGLAADELMTWTLDRVADAVAAYADPYIELAVNPVAHNTASFIAIAVQEFADVPILCKRDYQAPNIGKRPGELILRAGACYVRSLHKAETGEIRTQADMRALLDLATEKRLRRFISMAAAGGVSLNTQQQKDDREYDKELEDFK